MRNKDRKVDASRVLARYVDAAVGERKDRNIGTCGFCYNAVRCPGDILAHHGYSRPGDGTIYDTCPGAREKPWEISPATGELGVSTYKRIVGRLKIDLKALPHATRLPYGNSYIEKGQVDESTWKRTYDYQETQTKSLLAEATRKLKEYEERVRDWKPAAMTTVEEIEINRAERAKVVKEERQDRYAGKLAKMRALFQKEFDRVLQGEKILKATTTVKKAKDLAKVLATTCKAGKTIYDKYLFSVNSLTNASRGKAQVLKDLDIDPIFQHMGLLTSAGEYVKRDVASAFEDKCRWTEIRDYERDGLDKWLPVWPGWTGTPHIQYPPGSTGQNWYRSF